MPTTLIAPRDTTNEVLDRANTAWLTDPPPDGRPLPRLRRRPRNAAVWLTSGSGRGRGLGVVVRWLGDGPMHLGRIEAELALVATRLDADVLVLVADGEVAPPVVDAARRFVTATGRRAAVGRLDQLDDMLEGVAGLQVVAPTRRPCRPGAPAPTRTLWKSATDRSWIDGPHTVAHRVVRPR